jgi:protein-tyrosine phosphatase
MKTPLFWIPGPWKGRLATAPRPRGGDWLEDEIAAWKAAGLSIVVSTLTATESAHLDLDREQAFCATHGIEFFSFPISDREIPPSPDALNAFLMPLQTRLEAGDAVLVHCRMGIGRSSTLAACLLILANLSPEEAFDRICNARGCAVPDTPEQRRWVEKFATDRTRSSARRPPTDPFAH